MKTNVKGGSFREGIAALLLAVCLVVATAGVAGAAQKASGKAGNTVTVPDVTDMQQDQAETAISTAGLVVGDVAEEASDTVPEGQVIAQSPAANSAVPTGTAVDLTVSSGPEDAGCSCSGCGGGGSLSDRLNAMIVEALFGWLVLLAFQGMVGRKM